MAQLLGKYGGYRKLASYKVSNLIYDATVLFCNKYISKFSRTHDQMVQAARSGVQNIAEGSEASATSKKTEIKLTNVAKASLEELLLDYEAYLRQNNLPIWNSDDLRSQKVRSARPSTIEELRSIMAQLVSDKSDLSDKSDVKQEVSCNTMICLINQATYLLLRQIERLEADFLTNGGFTENLYKQRKKLQ